VIELIDAERCTSCNICVRVCPTDVFDSVLVGPPKIARQDVCQTCFMCEVHCPEDAMYVAPLRHPAESGSVHLNQAALKARGYLGSYRHRLGWGEGLAPPSTEADLLALAGAGPRLLDQPDSDVKPRVIR
jgi:NAD-dependent dihydropyrimidine dehydrogenase PreA subunit